MRGRVSAAAPDGERARNKSFRRSIGNRNMHSEWSVLLETETVSLHRSDRSAASLQEEHCRDEPIREQSYSLRFRYV